MKYESARAELIASKDWCEREGVEFSIKNFYDGQYAYEAIREQWFPYVEFIDIHQKGFVNITDEEMDFYNEGINPDYQDYSSDIFMPNLN